ncbi:MAG: hypothetical protein K6G83_14850 [Lachnospiraceae bacterium]|nr:hypothetical protein [Lachnospiraceae bacterium]
MDFSKIDERLKDSNTITCEFKSGDGQWRKARFIVSGRNADGRVTNAMYLVEDIDVEKGERDRLNDRIMSISNIFNTVHEIDLPTDTFTEIKNGSKYARDLASEGVPKAQETLRYYGKMVCDPASLEELGKFFDFSTLPSRLKENDTITSEFKNKDKNWLRARFIVSKRDETGNPVKLLYLTEYITAEREEREKLTERISSIANIYMSVHEFDIVENTVSMIKLGNEFLDDIGQAPQPHAREIFRKVAEDLVDPEFYEDCVRFFDFSTLP